MNLAFSTNVSDVIVYDDFNGSEIQDNGAATVLPPTPPFTSFPFDNRSISDYSAGGDPCGSATYRLFNRSNLSPDVLVSANGSFPLMRERLNDIYLSNSAEISSVALGLMNCSDNTTAANATNGYSGDDHRHRWNLLIDILLGFVLFSLCVLTFVGNAMVLHAVRTERRLQTVSNMFIISLAIADLVVGLIVMPISAIYIFTEDWHFGQMVCDLWIGVDYTASTASILNLFILSLDRYWSVTSPLKYLRKRTKKRALIMIGIVWFLSMLWIIPILGWHHFATGGVRMVPDNVCDTEYATDTVFKVITALFNYYIPLTIMFILYGNIFHEIRKRSEFELGRKNIGGSYFTSIHISTLDDSDNRNDTFAEITPPTPPSPEESVGLALPKSPAECETETSDDEIGRFHRKYEFNNANLIRMATEGIKSEQNNGHSPLEYKLDVEFAYDERVIDSNTEKIQPFLYEEHKLTTFRTSEREEAHGSSESTFSTNTKQSNISVSPKEHSAASCHFQKSAVVDQIHKSIKNDLQTSTKNTHFLMDRKRRLKSILSNSKTNSSKAANSSNNAHSPSRTALIAVSAKTKKSSSKSNHVVNSTRDHSSARNKAASARMFGAKFKRRRTTVSLTKEIKAARQLGVIMGAFSLCFLPYFIIFMVVAFCDGCIDSGTVVAVTWIGYLNSTLNPFLYPLCNAGFRRKFKKMLFPKKRPVRLSYHETRQYD
ncbi:histamine H1 receptor-like [Tubulanus polymorphus]|uniref:histamine H1 receptor-like n=1 Tax=Tubulanus polymorphus TaxID=672921 RepID=UPI003DA27C9B